jgi:hypothetical protein
MDTQIGDKTFRMERAMIDVTMLNRPDTNWRFTDANGHEHRYYIHRPEGVTPAEHYAPAARYALPTLDWIVDEEASDEYPEIGHYECGLCRATVQPRTTADTTRQMMPGLTSYYINDRAVSKDEYERQAREAIAESEKREG